MATKMVARMEYHIFLNLAFYIWQLCKNDKIVGKIISLMIAQCLHSDESLATPMSNNVLDSVKFGIFTTPSFRLIIFIREVCRHMSGVASFCTFVRCIVIPQTSSFSFLHNRLQLQLYYIKPDFWKLIICFLTAAFH